jgi:hypothetical protein
MLTGLGKIRCIPKNRRHITHPITHFNNREALKINQNDSTKITNQNLRVNGGTLKVGVEGRKQREANTINTYHI